MVHVTFELLFCLPMWLETNLELVVENFSRNESGHEAGKTV